MKKREVSEKDHITEIKIPYFEIYLIKNWLPIAKKKSSFRIEKEKQEIIRIAQQKLAAKDIDWNNWDEIPF